MKIGFIGFGEAARAFAGSLRNQNGLSFCAYDILQGRSRDAPLRAAAERLGVDLMEDPESVAADADWIFSAVTASDALDAAQSVAGLLGDDQVFIDINSVSAGRKREAANAVGADYVDMAVMAPVTPAGHRTPVLVAGPSCAKVENRMTELGFNFQIAGPEIGDATAIKMVRSMFVKGLEAVTVQALLAARASGCLDAVLASLSGSYPQFDWSKFPHYHLERVARHGVRRAAEMEESAASMRELGLPAGHALGQAIAGLQHEIGSRKIAIDSDGDLTELLDKVLARLRS